MVGGKGTRDDTAVGIARRMVSGKGVGNGAAILGVEGAVAAGKVNPGGKRMGFAFSLAGVKRAAADGDILGVANAVVGGKKVCLPRIDIGRRVLFGGRRPRRGEPAGAAIMMALGKCGGGHAAT
jgi:hypothetical protein